MSFLLRFKFFFSLLIAVTLLTLLASPLGEGSLKLEIFERKIRLKNHRSLTSSCNVTDKDSDNFSLIGTKLPTTNTYRVNTRVPFSIGANLNTIVNNSFDTWQSASGISFVRGANTSKNRSAYDGQNIIAWNRLSNSTLGATYIRYNPDTGVVVDVDTIMNNRHSWTWTNPSSVNEDQQCSSTNAYDAQNILVHELGHWIGLRDLYGSQDEDHTMFGYASKNELKKDSLEQGDLDGTIQIYGP
jgi:hypothetical protein